MSTTPTYRELPQTDLHKILDAHKLWVSTSPRTMGQQADLRNVNLCRLNLSKAFLPEALISDANLNGAGLSEANLASADLQGSDLSQTNLTKAILQDANIRMSTLKKSNLQGAKLQKANLSDASLQGANLAQADLNNAKLLNTTLREANLQDANLIGVTGLLSDQLAGTNLSGTRLPENIAKFDDLKRVSEVGETASKLFVSMLLGCVYAWLSIATTIDAKLLTNSASSPLPIIQTPVPIAGFYWAGPIILLAIYVWFHLYLQEMWKALAALPAIFPDGKALDEKADPWLLTGLVRAHFKLLHERRLPLSRLKVGISILLAWWIVPFTFVLFWLRYLPRHDWIGTTFHVALLVVTIVFAIRFQHLAKLTLRGEQMESIQFGHKWNELATYKYAVKRIWRISAAAVTTLILLGIVSDGAIEGIQSHVSDPISVCSIINFQSVFETTHNHHVVIPGLLSCIGAHAFADLFEAEVSVKPENWFLKSGVINLWEVVKPAQLPYANLRSASAAGAFLLRADLQGVNLRGANLQFANLEMANLYGADLQGADLTGAKLTGTNLRSAILQGTNSQYSRWCRGGGYAARLCSDVVGLTQEQINQACVDESTRLPSYLTRPKPCT